MATGTSRRSACTMVFIVLLDFAEFLKLEIFSFALITTTIFRLALLRIGPVFNCFIGGRCNPKQFICHTESESHNTLIINNLCLNPFRSEVLLLWDFVPIAGILRPIFGIKTTTNAVMALIGTLRAPLPRLSRSAVTEAREKTWRGGACASPQRGLGRPRHNVGRATSPVKRRRKRR